MNHFAPSATASLPLHRMPRLREWHAHAAAYFALSTGFFALAKGRADRWDVLVLAAALASSVLLARQWHLLSRILLGAVALAAASCIGLVLHPGQPGRQDALGLVCSSQAQILLMSALTLASAAAGSIAFLRRDARWTAAASRLTMAATLVGASAMLVRWFESYQAGASIGHVPISNLYEVFVFFVVITGSIQLVLQQDVKLRTLSGLLSFAPSAAVGFLLWYAVSRNAHELQPLVPALDSYWMKLHVPANFIGYGAFCLAAMVAAAWLLCGIPYAARRLPERPILESAMHRLIAVGFVFFSIATVLGALWAAEAWGSYWSWDPKETWALIVWLNYAAWLHMRLTGSARPTLAAWWALGGLLVTLFAFLGVNMYLSGLHSYGGL